ncbi:MAG: CD1845 family protein [Peptostreptococcaceae bacterium]|nr:CD1845 family protein [Peptostreptococcaceae bacterium]
MKLTRSLLKIVLFPITMILSILIAFFKFLIVASSIILSIISFIIFIAALASFIQKDTVTGIQGLVIAFLLSPFGLPKAALYITGALEAANEFIKAI